MFNRQDWQKKYYKTHRENILIRQKKYHEKNKGIRKKYYEEHKEHIKEYHKRYREANKDKIKTYMKRYHEAYYDINKEKIRERQKRYVEINKASILEKRKIYRQKLREKQMQRLGKNINLEDNDDVESIFKVTPPFTQIKPEIGYGYLGVILRDKIEDKIQCHICGKWFVSLASHLVIHKTNERDYKIKFSLPLTCTLTGRNLSRKRSEIATRRGAIRPILKYSKQHKINHLTPKRSRSYGRSNQGFQNNHDICEKQILKRYLIVKNIVSREPSISDLRKYDSALKSTIDRRYSNLNKFKNKYGFCLREQTKRLSDVYLISCLRKFILNNKRVPKRIDFIKAKPSYGTFIRHFGSWNNALTMAGY